MKKKIITKKFTTKLPTLTTLGHGVQCPPLHLGNEINNPGNKFTAEMFAKWRKKIPAAK